MESKQFSFKAKKSGQKVGNPNPILSTTPTINKFSLNAAAQKLMGLKEGDYICLYADEDEGKSRFFGWIGNESAEAKTAKGGFNYSGMYFEMGGEVSIPNEETKKTLYDVVVFQEDAEVEIDGKSYSRTVYEFVPREVVTHVGKVMGESSEEDDD